MLRKKNQPQAISASTLAGAAGVVFAVLMAGLFLGCGDTDQAGTATQPVSNVGDVRRPAPGTVQMIDAMNDISDAGTKLDTAPTFIDINNVSIRREGANLVFSIEVSGAMPEGPQPRTVVEWGFLLDNEPDGSPDWGIFTDLTTKDGWVAGVFNVKTRERLTGEKFLGTMSHTGSTLTMTVDAGAIGNPQSFKWFAYTDYTVADETGNLKRAGDKIWEQAIPSESTDWLPFP